MQARSVRAGANAARAKCARAACRSSRGGRVSSSFIQSARLGPGACCAGATLALLLLTTWACFPLGSLHCVRAALAVHRLPDIAPESIAHVSNLSEL